MSQSIKLNFLLLAATILLLISVVFAVRTLNLHPASGKRTLVIIDNAEIKNSHSKFLDILKERDYKVDIKTASSSSNSLQTYGEYLYDNLIILAPKASSIKGITPNNIIDFLESGHNVFVASSNVLSDSLREVANELGVEFDEDDTTVIDHFNFDSQLDTGKHNVITSDSFVNAPIIVGKSKLDPVLFKGLGIDFSKETKTLIPILRGSATSYSYSPENEITNTPNVAGSDTILVAGLQTKTGSRATFLGSIDLLSNKYFESTLSSTGKKSGNSKFVSELTSWSFQERGVLRHLNVNYRKINGTAIMNTYTINDAIEYNVQLQEFVNGVWVPFNSDDVQMEFIMLDPYIRKTLTNTGNGNYQTVFIAPDVYGVFQFKVDYKRTGYGPLLFSDQIIVRPYRINEYERFIESAFPYYAGAFSVMIGFFVFGIFFLYTRD